MYTVVCQEFSVRYYRAMTAAGMLLLELAAEGCGAPPDTLVSLFRPDPVSTLRYLHYPPREGPVPAAALDPTDSEWTRRDYLSRATAVFARRKRISYIAFVSNLIYLTVKISCFNPWVNPMVFRSRLLVCRNITSGPASRPNIVPRTQL